jgi:hypothetical protein
VAVVTIPLPEYFTPHTVVVQALTSGGGMGDTYAAPRDVAGFAQDEQKQVRAADGTEVVSTGQVTVNFDEDIPVGSLVTVWPDSPAAREAVVVGISRNEHPNFPAYQTLLLA